MRTIRIYTAEDLQESNTISLEAKAVKHIKDVLRMSAGESLILFNGDGHDYSAVISELGKKQIRVEIESRQAVNNESTLAIHLLQPLCRAEKMDWCLQKATELGVSMITPFISSRVNINLAANRVEKKMYHWKSVIQSACEQSGRARLPVLNIPVSFNTAINNSDRYALKLIASPTAVKNKLPNSETSLPQCICAIGPEGGFDQSEIEQAENKGFTSLLIGPRILRLETAVISALTLCQARWGDF